MMENKKVLSGASGKEKKTRAEFLNSLINTPIYSEELIQNLGLYLNRMTLSRILFMCELYKKIINVHGNILEFGVRWGQNLALFINCRGIFEPYNYNRKIIGFDTFEGFPSISDKDSSKISEGDYNVPKRYEKYLKELLFYHESEAPISHKKKFELIKGDATKEFEKYLDEHPELVVALAYFDFDLYKPTKKCLELLMNRVTKGSVIGFDELNHAEFPGETIALMEVLGLDRYAIKRSPLNPLISYLIIE